MSGDSIAPTPPQNLDAERSVLAAMLLNRDIVDEVVARISAEAFYRPAHQKIFSAMCELTERHTPIDHLSLAERLEARGELKEIGDKAYIIELANNDYAIFNWEHHVDIIKREKLLRDLIRAAENIKSLGYSETDDAAGSIEQAEKMLFDVTNQRIEKSFTDIEKLLGDSVAMLEKMAQNKTGIMGVTTGFTDLDRLLSGMRGGDLIILAARPGVGKTSLALNIAINAARSGAHIAFFSLEMPATQLTHRILSSEASVDNSKLRSGNLNAADWKDIIDTCSKLSELKFSIDDTPGLTITELRAKARRQLQKVEKGVIVLDYLQLMSAGGNGSADRWIAVGDISRGLKILAKELDVPILALSQLSRNVENRPNKRPQLSDLRESGNIEQDADVVMFIDRSLSEEEAEQDNRPPMGMGRLVVGKNRNGATMDIDLVFDNAYTRFRDYYRPQGM
ncbi:MAG TPA: replicative DNA helicase [Coriobacteriia bacterium]|nr:replicative DNA helicase [Coriobacteriia bacterium]